jgi:DNA-binding transcriptional ArsR family regulator
MSAGGARGFTGAQVPAAIARRESKAGRQTMRRAAWPARSRHAESSARYPAENHDTPRFHPPRHWEFITSHARVLLLLAHDPQLRVEEIADAANVSNRSVYRILADLSEAGYLRRRRTGARNLYELNEDLPLGDPVLGEQPVRDLLSLIEA